MSAQRAIGIVSPNNIKIDYVSPPSTRRVLVVVYLRNEACAMNLVKIFGVAPSLQLHSSSINHYLCRLSAYYVLINSFVLRNFDTDVHSISFRGVCLSVCACVSVWANKSITEARIKLREKLKLIQDWRSGSQRQCSMNNNWNSMLSG